MNPLRSILSLLVLVVAAPLNIASGQYTRPTPSAPRAARVAVESEPSRVTLDTIVPPAGAVTVSGFEKTLQSTRESMYVTNATDSDIEGLELTLDYTDMQGRHLHRAVHRLTIYIPRGETRMVTVPSADRQRTMYYHRSPAPRRADQCTPFDVRATVTYIIVEINSQNIP